MLVFALYIANKGANAAFSLALFVILARVLAPADYGAFIYLSTIVYVFSVLLRFGIDQTGMRNIAYALEQGRPGLARKTAILTVLASAALAALALPVLFFPSVLPVPDAYWPAALSTVFGLALWVFAMTGENTLSEVAKGLRCDWGAALIAGVLRLAVLIAALLAVVRFDDGLSLDRVICLNALSGLLAVLAGLLLVRAHLPVHRGPASYPPAREFAATSVAVWLSTSVYGLQEVIDIWMLGFYVDEADVAVYGSATRLAAVMVLMFHAFNLYVAPIVARDFAAGRLIALQRHVRGVTSALTLVALGLFGALLLFGSEILALVFGAGYAAGRDVLIVIAAYQLINIAAGPTILVMNMTGLHRSCAVITAFSAVLFFAVADAAIPRFGIAGAAFALLLAGTVTKLLSLIWIRHKLGIWTVATLSISDVRESLKLRSAAAA